MCRVVGDNKQLRFVPHSAASWNPCDDNNEMHNRAPRPGFAAPGDDVGGGMLSGVQLRYTQPVVLLPCQFRKQRAPRHITLRCSGILRMKAFPDTGFIFDDNCFAGATPSANSIKALCNVAVKVTVTGSGIVRWTPLVMESYGVGGPGPYMNVTNMNCQQHNASGLFQSESCPAAHPGLIATQTLSTAGLLQVASSLAN
jgi:hypothetical protein